VFIVVFLVLKAKAWGPILKGLQDRENRIKEDLEQAEGASKSAKATLAQYEQRLAAANDEARKIIEQGKVDAQKLAVSLREQAQGEITIMRQRAQDQIKAAHEQAISDIYEQTAVLATQVAGRILQREINPEDQRALVERSLSELGNRN
jgi:F-type H+-transporting ATPase subunit b